MAAEDIPPIPDPIAQAEGVITSAFTDYMQSPTGGPEAEVLADALDIVREIESAKEIEQIYEPGAPIPPGSDPEAVIDLLTKFTALHLQRMVIRGELPEPEPLPPGEKSKAAAHEDELDALVAEVARRVSEGGRKKDADSPETPQESDDPADDSTEE